MLWLNKFVRFLCGISVAVLITEFRETLSALSGVPKECYNLTNKRVCYFQVETMIKYKTWNDAWETCKENNSTLPTVENPEYQQHLGSYLETTLRLYGIWLAGRRMSSSEWQWKNGQKLSQQEFAMELHTNNFYETQAALNYKSGNSFFYSAEYPFHDRKFFYICYVDNMRCNHTGSVNYGKGCLTIHSEEQLDFLSARNKCFEAGGDLATFEHDETLTTIRGILRDEGKYWIGLRRSWWIWNTIDSVNEMVYSNWKDYKNTPSKDCLYMNKTGWTEEYCDIKRRFICQIVEEEKRKTEPTNGEGDFPMYLLIGAVVGVFVIALVIVILIILLRRQKRGIKDSKAMGQETRCEDRLIKYEAMRQTNETNEMVGIYDDISQTTNEVKKPHVIQANAIYAEVQDTEGNNRKSKNPQSEAPHTNITYATLEFEGNQ